jgi:hypothetical protein
MKFLKNHDSIALVVLMIAIFSAYILKDNVMKRAEYVQKHTVPHMEYWDIDMQTQPFLDGRR